VGLSPKHDVADSDYLLARAASEARMADEASVCGAAEIHHKLASAYLDRVFIAPPSPAATGDRRNPDAGGSSAAIESARTIFKHFSEVIGTESETSAPALFALLRHVD
jgi:hypothetical protein